MKQVTKEEAIKLLKSKFWENMTYEERFKFQLYQDFFCMPFDIFHESAEKTLDRPVWTHEFAFPELLKKEYLGERETPSFEEIVNLIPKDKQIIIITEEE